MMPMMPDNCVCIMSGKLNSVVFENESGERLVLYIYDDCFEIGLHRSGVKNPETKWYKASFEKIERIYTRGERKDTPPRGGKNEI